jgi:hypothetical protein
LAPSSSAKKVSFKPDVETADESVFVPSIQTSSAKTEANLTGDNITQHLSRFADVVESAIKQVLDSNLRMSEAVVATDKQLSELDLRLTDAIGSTNKNLFETNLRLSDAIGAASKQISEANLRLSNSIAGVNKQVSETNRRLTDAMDTASKAVSEMNQRILQTHGFLASSEKRLAEAEHQFNSLKDSMDQASQTTASLHETLKSIHQTSTSTEPRLDGAVQALTSLQASADSLAEKVFSKQHNTAFLCSLVEAFNLASRQLMDLLTIDPVSSSENERSAHRQATEWVFTCISLSGRYIEILKRGPDGKCTGEKSVGTAQEKIEDLRGAEGKDKLVITAAELERESKEVMEKNAANDDAVDGKSSLEAKLDPEVADENKGQQNPPAIASESHGKEVGINRAGKEPTENEEEDGSGDETGSETEAETELGTEGERSEEEGEDEEKKMERKSGEIPADADDESTELALLPLTVTNPKPPSKASSKRSSDASDPAEIPEGQPKKRAKSQRAGAQGPTRTSARRNQK